MMLSISNNFVAIKNSLVLPVLGQLVDDVAHNCQGPDGVRGAKEVGLAGALFVGGVGVGPTQVAIDG